MISIERQKNLFLAIAKNLKKPIKVYAIGGTAMMFHGFKDSTVDIDLVFTSLEDKNAFKRAVIELGYKKLDATKIYGLKDNAPEMLSLGQERFDLFVLEIIDFIFSKEMQERSEQAYQFLDNLILKIADVEDIILMKCATNRAKDREDILNIIKNRKVNWDILKLEAKNQVKLGRERAVMELGYLLEWLSNEGIVPKSITEDLYKFMKDQIERKLGQQNK